MSDKENRRTQEDEDLELLSQFIYSPEETEQDDRSFTQQSRKNGGDDHVTGHGAANDQQEEDDDEGLLDHILGDTWTPSQSQRNNGGGGQSVYSFTQNTECNDSITSTPRDYANEYENEQKQLEQLLQQVEEDSSQSTDGKTSASRQNWAGSKRQRVNYGRVSQSSGRSGTMASHTPVLAAAVSRNQPSVPAEDRAPQRAMGASMNAHNNPQRGINRSGTSGYQTPRHSTAQTSTNLDTHSRTRATACNTSIQKNIPGPAGRLSTKRTNRPAAAAPDVDLSVDHNSQDANLPQATQQLSYSESTQDVQMRRYERRGFFSRPWISMTKDYDRPAPTVNNMQSCLPDPESSLQHYLQLSDGNIVHIPCLALVVLSLTKYDDDTIAKVADPTDSITATIPRHVVEEFSPDFRVGAVIIVRRASMFSPTPGIKYLNIVSKNIEKVYSPNWR
eukprot:gb/GECG01008008.1/.p1 GENE.gb/GECG01008008.1/~~gb/GECG01008008.1/.p1  ORF type:complete len:447 (+),score=61.81 gb/GECG01008008.1/:1-1341(+)